MLSAAMARANQPSLATFLRGVAAFGGLEGRRLGRIIDKLEEQRWRKGEVIFHEGELGRTMYVLREGEVEVLRNSAEGKKVPIVSLGPGEAFGEMTLVELQPRSATIVVKKPSRTYSLNNLDLFNLYREDEYAYVILLQNICRMVSRRLRKADSRICEFLSQGKRSTRRQAGR